MECAGLNGHGRVEVYVYGRREERLKSMRSGYLPLSVTLVLSRWDGQRLESWDQSP